MNIKLGAVLEYGLRDSVNLTIYIKSYFYTNKIIRYKNKTDECGRKEEE
jgi:hypothetical protein